jgi:hypothetical protein
MTTVTRFDTCETPTRSAPRNTRLGHALVGIAAIATTTLMCFGGASGHRGAEEGRLSSTHELDDYAAFVAQMPHANGAPAAPQLPEPAIMAGRPF